ncbi:MAG: hypothetical protein CFH33_00217 [Alphaproteobacteria bacterium MarineAlpha9_Bin3]|nr:MAG: hypothetical protein CFH33_00217 [Alphaproteobacteria bacterium MarineAlpha9_Bin3]
MVQSTKEPYKEQISHNISLFKKIIYGLCPSCASISIFKYYIKLLGVCPNCGYVINLDKIGDGAAWFTMLITSIIVAVGVYILETIFQPDLWVHITIWFPVIFILSFLIIRPFKILLLCISNKSNR